MGSLTPTREQVSWLGSLPDEGPFVMINLLRFKREPAAAAGEESYGRYMHDVAPLLARAGGRLLWWGDVRGVFIGEQSGWWDRVLLVEYPSPGAFLGMITSPDYLAVHAHRESGLDDSALLVSRTRMSVMDGRRS